MKKVRAVRSWGDTPINGIPTDSIPISLGCASRGPDNIDDWVKNKIDDFLVSPGGWLILNLHGLDTEGWGPISTKFLVGILKKLSKVDSLDILPAGNVLLQTSE